MPITACQPTGLRKIAPSKTIKITGGSAIKVEAIPTLAFCTASIDNHTPTAGPINAPRNSHLPTSGAMQAVTVRRTRPSKSAKPHMAITATMVLIHVADNAE